MSSLIFIQQGHTAHLLSDGASYDLDGTLREVGSKFVDLPKAKSTMLVRGAAYPKVALPLLMSGVENFDAAAMALPQVLEQMIGTADEVAEEPLSSDLRHFEVTLLGWSDSWDQAMCVMACTFEKDDPGDAIGFSRMPTYRQYFPFTVGAFGCSPPTDLAAVLGTGEFSPEDVAGFDPEKVGLAVMEAQRLTPCDLCGAGRYIVGGIAEIATVTRAGLTRKVLKHWPDVIGEKISPEGAVPLEELEAFANGSRPMGDLRGRWLESLAA